MRFLYRILPTLLVILLFGVIYLGAKKTYNFYNANADTYYSSLVTDNLNNGENDETIERNQRQSDVNKTAGKKATSSMKSGKKAQSSKAVMNESPKNQKKQPVRSKAEVSLDEELEGKSSSQFLASADNTKSTKKVSSKKAAPSKAAAKKKSTLQSKGATPLSYEVGSENVQFLVIAGAFQSMNNANNFVDDLEDKGIKNAEIIKFKNKPLNSVCVSRHNDYNSAKAAIKALKQNQKIDAYVHRQPMK